MSEMVEKGLRAMRESKYVDFKRAFDPANAGEWCELIKDVVAMANTGGGVIMIGLDNGGAPSGEDVSAVLEIDHATIVDKLKKYTGQQFGDIEIHGVAKEGATVAAMEVGAVEVPMVFENVGTYAVSARRQKTAFARGTVYFRHGAKSEPGTTEDIRKAIERRVNAIRSDWLDGVRKVVTAPHGSSVAILSGEVRESASPDASPVRFVDDPNAPGYRLMSHDTKYPYRQKELIQVVNEMLPEGVEINTYDVLAVRRAHNIDANLKYQYSLRYGSPQYSQDFAEWLVDRHQANPAFFAEARKTYYAQTHVDG
jgi:hypothetical protein